jgi:hypothetical protein
MICIDKRDTILQVVRCLILLVVVQFLVIIVIMSWLFKSNPFWII